MRVKIAGTQEEIEIGEYRLLDKGALKGTFSIVEYPYGRKTLNCKLFEANGRQWFTFPQKEVVKEGQKTEYIPYVSFINKEFLKAYTAAVLEALKQTTPQERKPHEAKNSQAPKRPSNFYGDTSDIWGEAPF